MSDAVSRMAVFTYFRQEAKPTEAEGFTSVISIPFVHFDQDKIGDEEWEEMQKNVKLNTLKWFYSVFI